MGLIPQKRRYVTTLFFINALSRVSLSYQLGSDPKNFKLKPELASEDITDASFISGKELYTHSNLTNPSIRAYYENYKFGAAWAFKDLTRYMSIAILLLHVVLAVGHMLILLCTRRSSRAWGTIEELVILAYNSATRPAAFKNCSSGVGNSKTLEKKVRVGTRTLDDGRVQAELVVCGHEGATGDIVAGRLYS
jgi:hypothetical protein